MRGGGKRYHPFTSNNIKMWEPVCSSNFLALLTRTWFLLRSHAAGIMINTESQLTFFEFLKDKVTRRQIYGRWFWTRHSAKYITGRCQSRQETRKNPTLHLKKYSTIISIIAIGRPTCIVFLRRMKPLKCDHLSFMLILMPYFLITTIFFLLYS